MRLISSASEQHKSFTPEQLVTISCLKDPRQHLVCSLIHIRARMPVASLSEREFLPFKQIPKNNYDIKRNL